MKDEMYQLKVRAVLMRDSDIQLTKICRELHVVNSIFQCRLFIHGMHCIKPKQVKNNVWQGTTAGKYASQQFSASYAAQPKGCSAC